VLLGFFTSAMAPIVALDRHKTNFCTVKRGLHTSGAWRMNKPVSFREGAIPYWR